MKFKNCFVVMLGVAALLSVTSCGNTKVKKDGLAEVDSLATTYVNPLFQKGPDPWALFHEGIYYYMHTVQDSLVLWKTTDVTDVKNAPGRLSGFLPNLLINAIFGHLKSIISMANGISIMPPMMAIRTITRCMYWRM